MQGTHCPTKAGRAVSKSTRAARLIEPATMKGISAARNAPGRLPETGSSHIVSSLALQPVRIGNDQVDGIGPTITADERAGRYCL